MFVPLTWRFAQKGQSLTPPALDPIGCLTALLTKRLQLRRATLYPAELRAPIGLNRRNAGQRQRPDFAGWNMLETPSANIGRSNRLGRAGSLMFRGRAGA
jgi:hypothetical protein